MKCVVLSCENKTYDHETGVSFHRFPNNELRAKWLNAIGRRDLVINKKTSICSDHFYQQDLVRTTSCTGLSPTAIPVLNLTAAKQSKTSGRKVPISKSMKRTYSDEIIISDVRLPKDMKRDECLELGDDKSVDSSTVKTNSKRKRVDRKTPSRAKKPQRGNSQQRRNTKSGSTKTTPDIPLCCVFNCTTNRQSIGTMRLFTVPDDRARLSLWKCALGEKQWTIYPGARICSKHFFDRHIIKGGSYIGQDGLERHYKNNKWRLTEDATPMPMSNEAIDHVERMARPQEPKKIFKLESTCRTCSIEITDANQITQLFEGPLSLKKFRPDVFKELESFNLNVKKYDKLPQQICQKCLESFAILIQFRKQCQRVQNDLLEYFKENQEIKLPNPGESDLIMLNDQNEVEEKNMLVETSIEETKKELLSTNENDYPMIEEVLVDGNEIIYEDDENSVDWTCEYYIGPEEKNPINIKNEDLLSSLPEVLEEDSSPDEDDDPEQPSTPSPDPNNQIQMEQHKASKFIPDDSKNERRRCKLCQRITEYCCEICVNEPRLCLEPCFGAFHKLPVDTVQSNFSLEVYSCKYCSTYFPSALILETHIRCCPYRPVRISYEGCTEETLGCAICNDEFNNEDAFRNHVKELHGDDMSALCEYCNHKFQSVNHRDLHVKRMHPEGHTIFTCDVCNRSYTSRRSFKSHMHSIHGKGNYECNICHEMFTETRLYIQHKKQHIEKKNFKCSFCEKQFTNNNSRIEHERKHTGKKPFLCDLCGRSFPYEQGFTEHVKGHGDSNDFVCDICSKGFATKRKLRNHRHDHIYGPYIKLNCKLCKQKYERQNLIPTHMEKVHGITNENADEPSLKVEHICPICGKKFRQEKILEKHVYILHNPDRKFGCDMCKLRFATRDNMMAHRQRSHKKNRTYMCNLCPRGFFSAEVLERHIKGHSRKKLFKCPECPCTFKINRSLTDHLLSHKESAATTENNVEDSQIDYLIEDETIYWEECLDKELIN